MLHFSFGKGKKKTRIEKWEKEAKEKENKSEENLTKTL